MQLLEDQDMSGFLVEEKGKWKAENLKIEEFLKWSPAFKNENISNRAQKWLNSISNSKLNPD